MQGERIILLLQASSSNFLKYFFGEKGGGGVGGQVFVILKFFLEKIEKSPLFFQCKMFFEKVTKIHHFCN